MDHIIQDLSTASLERLVTLLEARIIEGSASHHDIDGYMKMQMEIALRLEPSSPLPVDPRD